MIGSTALVIALYLGNHAIFNLTVGLTSVLREVGRPRRLVSRPMKVERPMPYPLRSTRFAGCVGVVWPTAV